MMVDDLRDHDANPTPEERAWIEENIVGNVVRGLALAAVALGIGAAASLWLQPETLPEAVAASSR